MATNPRDESPEATARRCLNRDGYDVEDYEDKVVTWTALDIARLIRARDRRAVRKLRADPCAVFSEELIEQILARPPRRRRGT